MHTGVSHYPWSQHMGARQVSWAGRLKQHPVEFNPISDSQEEAAKAAILEKVMKGRQPTDLMLRCECRTWTFAPFTLTLGGVQAP
jgi:hypothetical protein